MAGGTFFGINMALRGLLAQQAALDVTGHNIANLHTEGYSRQRAELKTTIPFTAPSQGMVIPGQFGTGVQVTGVERLRDQFLDVNMRNQLSVLGNAQQQVSTLSQLEAMFNEPGDSGVASLMRDFFGALDDVAAHPEDLAARQTLVQAADAFASGVNQLADQIVDLQNQSDAWLNQAVTDINDITARIAELNGEIRDALQAGLDPNDLRDERDLLMDQLATKINYTYTVNPADEQVTITIGPTVPINLVDPAAASPFYTPIARADLDTAYTNGDLTAGEVFAHEQMWATTTVNTLQQLDDFVNEIVTQMNPVHAAGVDLLGGTGNDFWDPALLTAQTFAVDAGILADPRTIAAAAGPPPGSVGDGSNANGLLAMRDTTWGALGGMTWEGFYNSTVSGVGSQTASAMRLERNQGTLVDALQTRRDQVSGVSLDEEMANMLRFQHAYNASARVLTAFDEQLDTLINRMGRVGL